MNSPVRRIVVILWCLLPLRVGASPAPAPASSGSEMFLRLFNPQPAARTLALRSTSGIESLTIGPGEMVELPADASLDPSGLVATWRIVGADSEAQVLAMQPTAADCGEPVRILVAGTACRFGTAGALVEDISGATYRWTIEGGAILSGDGTASPVFAFGSAEAAVLRVEITSSGCTRSGAATVVLRPPFEIASLASSAATAGAPVILAWTYATAEEPRTQRLTLGGQPVALPLSQRSYTFTPATEGAIDAVLEASLVGGRRRAVAFPGSRVPYPSACSSDRRSLRIDVRPACTLPQGSISASGPTSFCEGGTVTLTAPEGTSYEWSTGAHARTIAAATSGQYSVVVANGPGCERSFGPVGVTVTRPPAISLSVSPSSIEAGGEATLTVTCVRCAGGSVTSARGPSSLTPNGGDFSGSGTFTFMFRDAEGPANLAFTATGTPLSPCSQGASDQKTLSIVAPQPRIDSFTADSYVVSWFSTTTLRFTIASVANWRLLSSRHNGRTPASGNGSGSFTSQYSRDNQAGPDVITLEVTGMNGAVITRDLPQPIEGPAQIVSFTADS